MVDLFHVSANEFVVKLPESKNPEDFRRHLAELGTVEALPASPGHLHLRLTESASDVPKIAWNTVRKFLAKKDKNVAVGPVLLDEHDNPRYSLGTVTVRFKESPSEQEVASFGDLFGLRFRARNSFIPAQVSFEPLDSHQFLPDVVEHVRKEGDIVAVWPETLSFYKRG